jgi:hypothetical protein
MVPQHSKLILHVWLLGQPFEGMPGEAISPADCVRLGIPVGSSWGSSAGSSWNPYYVGARTPQLLQTVKNVRGTVYVKVFKIEGFANTSNNVKYALFPASLLAFFS